MQAFIHFSYYTIGRNAWALSISQELYLVCLFLFFFFVLSWVKWAMVCFARSASMHLHLSFSCIFPLAPFISVSSSPPWDRHETQVCPPPGPSHWFRCRPLSHVGSMKGFPESWHTDAETIALFSLSLFLWHQSPKGHPWESGAAMVPGKPCGRSFMQNEASQAAT